MRCETALVARSITMSAQTVNLDRGGAHLEASAAGVTGQSIFGFFAVKLVNLSARFAYLEGRNPRMDPSVSGVTADNESIQTFEPVYAARFNELFQGTIHLQRRFEAFIAQPIKDPIGAQWLIG